MSAAPGAAPDLVVSREGSLGVVRLNRPRALNVLTLPMVREFTKSLDRFEADLDVAAVLPEGAGEDGLCAGGDIRALYDSGRRRRPVPARGVHARRPHRALPEAVRRPHGRAGDGRRRRHLRPRPAPGRHRAHPARHAGMRDRLLPRRRRDLAPHPRAGLVSRVLPAAELLAEAMRAGETIAAISRPSAMMVEIVNRAEEVGLTEGLRFEGRAFQSLFATHDQEGMAAFVARWKAGFSARVRAGVRDGYGRPEATRMWRGQVSEARV